MVKSLKIYKKLSKDIMLLFKYSVKNVNFGNRKLTVALNDVQ